MKWRYLPINNAYVHTWSPADDGDGMIAIELHDGTDSGMSRLADHTRRPVGYVLFEQLTDYGIFATLEEAQAAGEKLAVDLGYDF